MLSIQTNYGSMAAQENLRVNTDFQTKTIERVTSGFRINQSGDDAAGLSVANGYRSAVAELSQGVRNANDGVSTLQIIDGGLNNITKMLDRLKTLATQSATDTFTGDRDSLNDEFTDVVSEITRQAQNIGLDAAGAWLKSLSVYVGGGSGATVTIDLSGAQVDADGLGLNGDATQTPAVPAASIDTAANATTAIGTINTALGLVGTYQGVVGTGQNKLSYAIQLAESQITNFSTAESRIRDADMAREAANLTKAQVLQQASLAAMAQANTAPQAVLSLLKG
jgi:flagellin